jgi:hypothetical protein
MLDMDTDNAIIFYSIFPLTAPFVWAFILYMAVIPIKLTINLKKTPSKNEYNIFRNLIINTLLIVLSGIIYILFQRILFNIGINQWNSIFRIIIFCSFIIFSNIAGIILSIININKIIIQIAFLGVIIISTVVIQYLTNIIWDLFVRYNSINALQYYFRLGIVIIIENIISTVIIKRVLHKLRGNRV